MKGTTTQQKATLFRERILSLLVSAVMGCVLISFLEILIFEKVWAGLVYPLLAAALMKMVHGLLVKFRPLDDDPEHTAIQESVILGGLLSVVGACLVSQKLSVRDLVYGGVAMGLLALLSIGLEQFHVTRESRAARKAKVEAEKARRLAEDGDLGFADEMLQEALLTTEIAFGSHHPQVATIVTYLAEVTAGLGRTTASTLMLRRAVEVYQTLESCGQEQVAALSRYAEHLRHIGKLDEALTVASRAVVVSRRVHGDKTPTGNCLISLAKLQASLGQTASAYKSCNAAVRILEVSLGRNHRETLKARGLVVSHCVAMGRLAEGQRLLSDLMALRERLEEREGYDADDLSMLLDLTIVQRRSEPEEALRTYARAVSIFRSSVGPTYERSTELLQPLPSYLASTGPPALEQYYTVLCSGEPSPARQILRDHPGLAKVVDASGWTPLQWACFFGYADIVSSLLGLGADLEHGRDVDYPALYVAARWGRHRSVADIIGKGTNVDLNIVCADGSSPLHGAVRSGDQLTFDILISRKARLDVTNARGWTPLHEAACLGQRKFLVQLISEGVDPNTQAGPSFDTPLHAAAVGNSWLTAETLILNLARIDLLNSEDLIPIELAQQLWHERVVAVLAARGKVGVG